MRVNVLKRESALIHMTWWNEQLRDFKRHEKPDIPELQLWWNVFQVHWRELAVLPNIKRSQELFWPMIKDEGALLCFPAKRTWPCSVSKRANQTTQELFGGSVELRRTLYYSSVLFLPIVDRTWKQCFSAVDGDFCWKNGFFLIPESVSSGSSSGGLRRFV